MDVIININELIERLEEIRKILPDTNIFVNLPEEFLKDELDIEFIPVDYPPLHPLKLPNKQDVQKMIEEGMGQITLLTLGSGTWPSAPLFI